MGDPPMVGEKTFKATIVERKTFICTEKTAFVMTQRAIAIISKKTITITT